MMVSPKNGTMTTVSGMVASGLLVALMAGTAAADGLSQTQTRAGGWDVFDRQSSNETLMGAPVHKVQQQGQPLGQQSGQQQRVQLRIINTLPGPVDYYVVNPNTGQPQRVNTLQPGGVADLGSQPGLGWIFVQNQQQIQAYQTQGVAFQELRIAAPGQQQPPRLANQFQPPANSQNAQQQGQQQQGQQQLGQQQNLGQQQQLGQRPLGQQAGQPLGQQTGRPQGQPQYGQPPGQPQPLGQQQQGQQQQQGRPQQLGQTPQLGEARPLGQQQGQRPFGQQGGQLQGQQFGQPSGQPQPLGQYQGSGQQQGLGQQQGQRPFGQQGGQPLGQPLGQQQLLAEPAGLYQRSLTVEDCMKSYFTPGSNSQQICSYLSQLARTNPAAYQNYLASVQLRNNQSGGIQGQQQQQGFGSNNQGFGNAGGRFPAASSWGGIVRTQPSMQSDRLDSLSEGEVITLLADTGVEMNGYNWFQIQFRNGQTGYQWGGIICGQTQPIPGTFEICK